jgi:hypothetical protein
MKAKYEPGDFALLRGEDVVCIEDAIQREDGAYAYGLAFCRNVASTSNQTPIDTSGGFGYRYPESDLHPLTPVLELRAQLTRLHQDTQRRMAENRAARRDMARLRYAIGVLDTVAIRAAKEGE